MMTSRVSSPSARTAVAVSPRRGEYPPRAVQGPRGLASARTSSLRRLEPPKKPHISKARATASAAPPRPSAAATPHTPSSPSTSSSSSSSASIAALNSALAAHIALAAETAPQRAMERLNGAVGAYMGRVARGELPMPLMNKGAAAEDLKKKKNK